MGSASPPRKKERRRGLPGPHIKKDNKKKRKAGDSQATPQKERQTGKEQPGPPEDRNNDIKRMAASHPQKGRQKEIKNGRGTQLPQKARTQINKKGGGEPGTHPERPEWATTNPLPPKGRKKETKDGDSQATLREKERTKRVMRGQPGSPQKERTNGESGSQHPPERQ